MDKSGVRRAVEMGSEGWAVFDGHRMIASNLTKQDAQVLENADALLAVRRALHTGNYSQDDPVLRKALAALPADLTNG